MGFGFRVVRSQEVKEKTCLVGRDVKDSVLISGDWNADYALGLVVIDNVIGKAEVHEDKRDVWFILSGSGSFILGGDLIHGSSSKPGEWNAPNIFGGKTHPVGPGDLVDISPGTAHQVDARGGHVEALIVKVPR